MNFIKKLFNNEVDESVHRQFSRFSKGTYNDRALIEINNSKKVKIKTSFEFANDFVSFMAGKTNEKVKVKGAIICTRDISSDLGVEVKNVKQFMGIRTIEIDNDLEGNKILEMINKYPDALFLISFDNNYGSLKIKPKSPKSAKPGKGGEEAKADFCSLTTEDKKIIKEFAFDVDKDFKKLKINHTFVIESLEVPEEYKNDFSKARYCARRKGKIIRVLNIDGEKKVREINFEA